MELPRHVGPYRVVEELTSNPSANSTRRCLAVGSGPVPGPVVLSLPPSAREHDTAFHIRFRAEGEKSRRMVGPAALPAVDVAPPDAPLPWVAAPYVPVLPLQSALEMYDGRFPQAVVCRLGASLAATLAANHANGLVHAGITLDAVLLAADGPRLVDFGALRAGTWRAEGDSLRRDEPCLPPVSGRTEPPVPAGDVYALGTVLGRVATGRFHPSPEAIPEPLRQMLDAACAHDPARRPQAAVLAAELAAGQDGTWLPEPLLDLLAGQDAAIRAAQRAEDAETLAANAATGSPKTVTSGAPRRRAVLTATVAAAVGLMAGGAAAYPMTRQEQPARPERPRSVKGVAPAPLWQIRLPHGKGNRIPAIWEDRVAVFSTAKGAVGIDLRTGEQLWDRAESALKGDPTVFGSGEVLLPGSTFRTVSADSGEVQWSKGGFGNGGKLRPHRVLAAAGGTVWFEATPRDGSSSGAVIIALDAASREQRWTTELRRPLSDASALLRPDALLLQGDDGAYAALDRQSGKKLWSRKYKGLDAKADVKTVAIPGNRLLASVEESLAAFDMRERKASWVFSSESGTLGEATHHHGTVYVTDSFKFTYALDASSGTVKWKKNNDTSTGLVSTSLKSPPTDLSHSRRTLLASNASSVDAYDAANGQLHWRFTPLSDGERRGYAGMVVGRAKGLVLVQNEKTVYALPVD